MKLIGSLEKHVGRFNLLLVLYTIINVLQAIFTPLHDDEAYYWVYSQNLEWGYFDHPPAVAVLVKLGSFFSDGVLGVRLMTILLSIVVLKLIWKLIPESDREISDSILIFFGIIVSIPGFNMYSFITTPDVPLIFSFVIYLFALNSLNKEKSLTSAAFLGIAAAMLIYSKYHGGIIILLSVIVQPKLLKSWTLYLGGFIALLLISPHLLWEYNHDFISFDYHLFQRTSGAFKIDNPLGYIGGAFGILNPALVVLMFLLTFKFRNLIPENNKIYLRLFWGLLIFFFIYSFRGRIEAQWVIAAFIPMVLLLHTFIVKNKMYLKSSKRIFSISILVLLIVRVLLAFSPAVEEIALGRSEDYYKSIARLVPEDSKVVFLNSFQKTSKYKFFTRREAMSFNAVNYRKNQYDVNNYEDDFNSKKVFFNGWGNSKKLDTLRTDIGDRLSYAVIDKYVVFTKVKAEINYFSKQLNSGKNTISVSLKNPYDYDLHFNGSERFPLKLKLMLINKEEKRYFIDLENHLNVLISKSSYQEQMNLNISDEIPRGKYKCQIVVSYVDKQYISNMMKVKVE